MALIAFDETKTIIPQAVSRNFGPQDVQYYFVDGNLADYSSDFDEGTLEGTLGTLPGQDRPQEFLDALNEVWGEELTEFAYSGESYDAAIVIALAAVAAGDDSGEAIASQLQSVADDGTECTTFAECIELLDAGEDIDYVGISGPVEFDENGDQSAAVIGVYEYGADNTPSAVDFVEGELQ